MTKVKRSQFKTFINVMPTGTASYKLLGEGVTTGMLLYNPNTTTETYIHEDTAHIDTESYAPTMPVEMSAINGSDVFEFVDAIRKRRAVLSDAETDIVNVWVYETPTGGNYPAEKQNVAIALDSFGGDGGTPVKLNFTLNYLGDPTIGSFNPSSGTWSG